MESPPVIDKITEEYNIWKKNTPLLYDIMFSHTLEWPSLTSEFFPEVTLTSSKDYFTHRLLLGTYTSGEEPNHILIGTLSFPNTEDRSSKFNDPSVPGGYRGLFGKFNVKQKITQQVEPNRLRYMKSNPNVIASKLANGLVLVYDITEHPTNPTERQIPELTLKGCEQEGYALSWGFGNDGILLSGGGEGVIFEWGVNSIKEKGECNYSRKYEGHKGPIEDICFSFNDQNTFVSVSDDRSIIVWDRREDKQSMKKENAHEGDVNCVDMPLEESTKIATGGGDKKVRIWDIRKMEECENDINAHEGDVLNLKFSPFSKDIIASSSDDRRVNVFDLSEKDNELIFVHAGHKAKINDISWNYNSEWLLCSVSEDNMMHVWKMAE